MKISAGLALLSLVGSLVDAGPILQRKADTKVMNKRLTSDSVGAAYFITNEAEGNFVVSADISSDGQLHLRQAVNSKGNGAHGTTDPQGGPDPLFSQGAVKVSAAMKMLATVNAGSNTVTAFSIDPEDPAILSPVGEPVSSGGEFPMSLAFSPSGNMLCVLNGGAVNGVSCFTVDAQGLSPKSGTTRSLQLNQTSPATGPAGTASHIIFSEDGSKVIASIKGAPPTPGFLAVWDVQADGSLSQDFQNVAPPKGGLLPFGMALIPGQNAVLVTDAGLGFDIVDMENVGNATAGNDRSSATTVDGQKAVCWAAFSKQTQNFYLTDIGTSQVTEVSLDTGLKPTIVKQYAQADNSGTIDLDIATVGQNDFLFVLSANATAVDVLSLNAPGQATHVQTLDIAGPAKTAGLTISSDNLQGMTTFVKQ